ncbi:MAG: hypothetical protein ABIR32_12280, partial [Ilumatobacteraceae bacterium]
VRGGRWVVDVALSGVAASMSAGPMVSLDSDAIASPRARAVVRAAPGLGQHTDGVLAELGIRR